jgi:hypothetical protein
MIESGTTTYADMYYFEEEIARVTKAAGLRGVLGETIIQFPVGRTRRRPPKASPDERFAKEFAGDDLITPAVAPHAMYTNDADDAQGLPRARGSPPHPCHHPSRRDEGRDEDVGREVPRDADGVLELAGLLGTADAGRARRPRHAGGHRDPRPPATSASRTTPRAT